VHRLTVDQHGAGPAVAGVAPALDLGVPVSRRRVRRHCPGVGAASTSSPLISNLTMTARSGSPPRAHSRTADASPRRRAGRCIAVESLDVGAQKLCRRHAFVAEDRRAPRRRGDREDRSAVVVDR
jgi:hypothetical protein